MGKRLSKIVTRTGDAGTTGLGDGSRTSKCSHRIDAIGEIDELNSALGVLLTESLHEALREALTSIQHDLFDLGGELCLPGVTVLRPEQIARLEQLAVRYNSELPPLQDFILPGGTRSAALTFLVRAICRRAERALVNLAEQEPVSDYARQYLNRLSDLLFILGRVMNRSHGVSDVLWQKAKNAEIR